MALVSPPLIPSHTLGRVHLPRATGKPPPKVFKVMTSIARGEANSSREASKAEEMAKRSYIPSSEKHVVVGCGAVSVDYLASVAKFPQPDEKIRSIDFKVQGGGNCGNALTATARLGLEPRIISKVADDAFGKLMLEEFKADDVDTSFIVVSENGTSSFTYIIVDREENTRTCIHSPGNPPMDPKELSDDALNSVLDGASILYLDGRLTDTALRVANEAKKRKIPVLVDAERKREGLDNLLEVADYVVCSSKFPQAWTEALTLPEALIEMASRLPELKFVIVTLGASGCVMLERSSINTSNLSILDAQRIYESLLMERESRKAIEPFVVSSKMGLFRANSRNGDFTKEIAGRFLMGTAETIPSSELADTTGAGDAFIGAVLYAICATMSPEKMLTLGAVVAGANCRALGARGGLPYHHDPKLIPFLESNVVKSCASQV